MLEPDGAHRKVHPLDMTRSDLLQLFRGGRQRTDKEQKAWLDTGAKKSVAQRARHKKVEDSPDVTGPRPENSAVSMELNWAAKKVIAAAVKLCSSEKGELQANFSKLKTEVEEYLELGEAA